VIDDEGNQVGMMKTPDAVRFAQERDLDLVEVAPEAKPPVCRVLDYSKYKYEQAQKLKQARKHQQQITIREIKFRPKIAQHDYDTKKHHVERFLRHKDKVKITIMFRGREVTHPERGVAILDRLAEELAELGVVEQRPTQDGRNMTMMLGPSKAVLAGKADGADGSIEAPDGEVSSNGVAETPHAASDGTGDTAAIVEMASDDAGDTAAIVEMASDDAGESAAIVEVASDGTGDTAAIVEMASDDAGESAAAVEAASDGTAETAAVEVSPNGAEPAPDRQDGESEDVVS